MPEEKNFTLTPTEINQILRTTNVQPQKKFGQNFLINESTIQKILITLDPKDGDSFLEIGPGLGAITLPLAGHGSHVQAYEIDKSMSLLLQERVKQHRLQNNVDIVNEDFLQANIVTSHKIFSSLPYNQTSPILHKLINNYPSWQEGTFLMQKEVAEKITAQTPAGNYWSQYVQMFFSVTKEIPTVKPSNFWPVPGVNSTLLKLERRDTKKVTPEKWSGFLHTIFKHPRKQIGSYYPKEKLKHAEIPENYRAAQISQEQLLELFNCERKSLESQD